MLTTALGRAPTDAELYLAHQQDGSGAAKLLTNPNTPAGQLVNPKAISANGGDPNAPAKQFTDMWIKKFNATPSYIGDAAGGTGSAPGSTPSAANSYFVGDSIADQLKRAVPGAAGNTLKGRPPAIVQNIIANTDPADFAGKTVYLSSGAANAYDPKSIAAVEAQITTLTKPIAQGGNLGFLRNDPNTGLSLIAIIDVTGRRTSRHYTTPVRAVEQPDDFIRPEIRT